MTRTIQRTAGRLALTLALLLGNGVMAMAQNGNACSVRDNRMYIELRKDISDHELDAFIERYDLSDLYLKAFLRRNMADSLKRQGWKVETNNQHNAVIYRPLFAETDLQDPAQRFRLTSTRDPRPEGSFGANRFVNKYPFRTQDAEVTFFLRGRQRAGNVQLAGSFTNWKQNALRMTRVDSGWIANVRLTPGKYWYKFIVDGSWEVDGDNYFRENDGQGNINSVYYKTNYVFRLNAAPDARTVVLSGSFNNWNRDALRLRRSAQGWELPAYVGEGTFLYKYIVDGRWMTDPANTDRIEDGQNGFNSVIRKGRPVDFRLNGFGTARRVALAGTFNGWRRDELFLQKTASGWELPFVLAAGQYEYKFIVDGRWMPDPANPLNTEGPNGKGNSILVVGANYTFRIADKPGTRSVFLGGDFNDWNPRSFPMRKEGDHWTLSLFLPAGKHRYKYLVNGAWILDPGNKLWEQNEFNTGNSVVWVD